MNNKPVLSTLYTRLSSHVSGIREDIRLIKREQSMLNRDKIAPIHEFYLAYYMPFATINVGTSLLQNSFSIHSQALFKRLGHRMHKNEVKAYIGERELLTKESEQLYRMAEAIFWPNPISSPDLKQLFPDLKEPIPYYVLDDLLEATAYAISDTDFKKHTFLSPTIGGGKIDLKIWQNVNAIHDYSDKFDYEPPVRRRKKREHKQGLLKWSPKAA